MEEFLDRFGRILSIISVRYFIFAGTAFIIFYVLFKNQFLDRKIQVLFPGWTDHRRDIFYSLVTIFIFAMVAVLVLFDLAPYTLLIEDIEQRSTGYYLFTMVGMFFLHDFYFYWAHRLMHHRRLYKLVHRVHHLATNPSPWTAYAFHPIEAIVEAGIIALIAFMIPTHRSMIALFLLFQFVYNVYGHLGYELYPRNFHKTKIGRWINTSVAHNLHHKRFHGNFGLYTLIWDRVFGTLRSDYEETYEAVWQKHEQVAQ